MIFGLLLKPQTPPKKDYIWPCHLQIFANAPLAIYKSLSLLPSIVSMHKPCMYPIVISFGEQKWQISCKSSQVDYTLISEADAWRAPHNCPLRLKGQECPELGDEYWSAIRTFSY